MKKDYTVLKKKALSMQYHSINIEKLPKRMKSKLSNIALLIIWNVGADSERIISQKSNAFESSHESDIEWTYVSFLEKKLFGKSILTLYKAFKVTLFTVILLLQRNTSLLPIRPWREW